MIAEKKYWASKAEYGKGVPMEVRMKRFAQNIVPVALHCADGWAWQQRLGQLLRSWERRMLRRINGVPNKSDEDFFTWQRRAVGVGCYWFEEQLKLDRMCVSTQKDPHDVKHCGCVTSSSL